MNSEKWPDLNKPLAVWLGVAVVIALAAAGYGFYVDSRPVLTQPDLFWPFVILSLAGTLVGGRIALRNDRNPLRNVIGMIGSLVAWRVSYFPFMVVAGWKGSLGEAVCWELFGTSVVYPFFLFFTFAQHAGTGFIGAAAVAKAQSIAPTQGPVLFFRKLFHQPPRKLLWALACVALPVAGMVSFSTTDDFVLFNDGPAPEMAKVQIAEPEVNPYAVIMNEHDLSVPAWVLAVNARLTYPLVPHSPWGRAMKGTLEAEALKNPTATTRDRIDEHYQAWIASHARIHNPQAGP